MKVSFKLKALVAGAALFAAGAASANTSLGVSTGNIWVDVWDQTTGTTFAYDTGLTQGTFNGSTTSYSTSIADSNWSSFFSGVGASDTVTYNVVSVGTTGVMTSVFGGGPSQAPVNSTVNNALTAASGVASALNGITSTTSNSAYVSSTSNQAASWGAGDPGWNTNLSVDADGSLGTALNFYSYTFGSGSHASHTSATTVTEQAFTWDLTSAGLLTYNPTSVGSVPVPAPFGLLVAGLALMGIIARRGKTSEGGFGGFAA